MENKNCFIRGIMFVFCGFIPFFFLLRAFYFAFYRYKFSCPEKLSMLVIMVGVACIIGYACIILFAGFDLMVRDFREE